MPNVSIYVLIDFLSPISSLIIIKVIQILVFHRGSTISYSSSLFDIFSLECMSLLLLFSFLILIFQAYLSIHIRVVLPELTKCTVAKYAFFWSLVWCTLGRHYRTMNSSVFHLFDKNWLKPHQIFEEKSKIREKCFFPKTHFRKIANTIATTLVLWFG